MGTLAVATQARADDLMLPGSNCVKFSSGGTATYNYSRIGNSSSTSAMSIDCPVIDTGLLTQGVVVAFDRSTASNMTCALNNITWSETQPGIIFLQTKTTNSTSGSANLPQTIGASTNYTNMSFEYQYWSCSIPATSGGNISYIGQYLTSHGG